MSDDLVDDAVGQGVQAGDLAARTASPPARRCGSRRGTADLSQDVAGSTGGKRPRDRRWCAGRPRPGWPCPAAHQDRLGGGGADVQAQDAASPAWRVPVASGLEIHWCGELRERRQAVEGGDPLDKKPVEPRERGRFRARGPTAPHRAPRSRAPRRGHHEPGDLLAQVLNHHAVLGGPTDDHDIAAVHLLEEFKDLVGHHFAQAGRDLGLGDALVVAWVQSDLQNTEQRPDTWCGFSTAAHRAASSRPIFSRRSCCRKNSPVPEAHLLPVTTLAMRPDRFNTYTMKVSPPADTTAGQSTPAGFSERIGEFHRLRLGDGGQIDESPEFPARGDHPGS